MCSKSKYNPKFVQALKIDLSVGIRYLFIIILSLFLFQKSATGQLNKDSTYNYQDLNRILELARSNNDQKTLAETYVRLADYEGDVLGAYDKSIEYYRRALEYFKVNRDSSGINETNHSLARRYTYAGFHNDAIALLQALASIYHKSNNNRRLAHVYYDLNRAYKARGETENSLQYLARAEEINKVLLDTGLMTKIFFDKIQVYESVYETDSALVTAFRAFNVSVMKGDNEVIARSLYYIGQINRKKNDTGRAIKYLTKSEDLLPNQPYSELRKLVYRELADAYFQSGQHVQAYGYLSKYATLNDSILNKNRLASFTNLALKYGAQDKQSSIELLRIEKQYAEQRNKAQRRTLYILAAGLFLLTCSIYFIVKYYNQKISTAKIITEQKEEINQQKIRELEDNMKMSSMRFVIEGQEIERERIAKDLHDSLGGLLSTIKLQFDQVRSRNSTLSEMKEYNKAVKLLDSAVDEVRDISRNLQPGSLQNFGLVSAIKDLVNRFEGEGYPEIDFQHYDIPEKMDRMISMSVYRIIQELLTNSLKHAHAYEILIQINTEEDELVIQYEDDGVGFDQSQLARRGMGLENIRSRVNYLHGNIVMDSKKEVGTSVLIRVKYA